MAKDQPADAKSDLPALPAGIGNPARNTLEAAGVTRLDRLTDKTEREIAALHGMGPKALGILRDALATHGQSFKDATSDS